MSRPIDPRLARAVPALRRLLAVLAVVAVLGALLTVAQAGVLAGLVVSIVLRGGHGSSLTRSLVLLAGVGAGRAAVAAGQEWLTARASRRVRAGLRRSVLNAVVRLGPGWVSRQPAGRLVTAAGPGLEALDGYLTRAVPALVAAGVVPVIVLARIGLADWQSALLLVATLPLVPVFMALVGVTTSRRMAVQYATLARLAGHFLDLVQGLTTLKVYGQAGRQVETVRRATEDYRRRTMHTLRFAFLSGLVLDLIATLSVAVVAVDVGLRLDHGHTDLRTALVVLLLAPELFAPLRAVGAQHHASEEGRVAAAAALDILDEAAAVPAVQNAAPPGLPGLPDGSIRIGGLVVTYPGRAVPALRGLDLAIAPGEVVAVQGESGGGKSTLLAVLLGFVRPAGGTVSVGITGTTGIAATGIGTTGTPGALGATGGEADLAALDPVGWRAGTAWAPQLPHPTQDTVAAEVLLGDPRATRSQALAAIADCRAPHPDTPLGEDGARVSAGQRRRVGLARALLRARAVRTAGGVPIVLLDEPSEDLDADTEEVVAAVIGHLAGWATVLLVTHSSRLARVADRRVEVAGGRVAAEVHQRRLLVQAPPPPDPRPAPRRTAATAPPRAPLRTLLGGLPDTAGAPTGTHRRDRAGREPVGGEPALRIAGRRLLSAGLLCGATGLAGLALTASSVWLICRAAQHPNVQALALAVVGVRTFALARALLRYAERLVGHDGALRLLADVRARVFAALVPLAPAGLAELRRGDLLRRFVSDVDGAQEGLVRAVVPLTGAALTAAGAVTVAAVAAPAAGALLGAGLVVGLLLVPALARRVAGDAGALAAAAGLRDERTSAFLDGVAELAAYGADTAAVAAVAAADATVVRAARRPALAAAAGAGLGGVSAAVTLPLVLAAGGAAAAAGTLSPVTVGVLAACVLAGFDALGPLPAAFAAWSGFRAGLDRVAALLATPPPLPEPAVPARVPARVAAPIPALVPALVPGTPGVAAADPRYAVGLDVGAVTLAPAARAPAVLTGATLALHPGERIALMGPSGCGKSTFLTAALRLLPVRAGRLDLVAGGRTVALADVAAADVPPLVAGSLQGDHVFRASLRDNLRVVRPAASDAELDVVAARAGLATFVHEVAGGWSAPAGADGGDLSGGERQRLLLARALLADPAVLVLDEPTAHLDPVTERAVLADLLAGTRGQTLLMSTHRELPEGSVDALVHVRRGSLHADGPPVAVLGVGTVLTVSGP